MKLGTHLPHPASLGALACQYQAETLVARTLLYQFLKKVAPHMKLGPHLAHPASLDVLECHPRAAIAAARTFL